MSVGSTEQLSCECSATTPLMAMCASISRLHTAAQSSAKASQQLLSGYSQRQHRGVSQRCMTRLRTCPGDLSNCLASTEARRPATWLRAGASPPPPSCPAICWLGPLMSESASKMSASPLPACSPASDCAGKIDGDTSSGRPPSWMPAKKRSMFVRVCTERRGWPPPPGRASLVADASAPAAHLARSGQQQ